MKILLVLVIFVGCYTAPVSFAQKAKQYLAKEQYDQAIDAYKKHIDSRLKRKSRPEWENPYVYYLDIGDVYLLQNDLDNALKYYFLAEEKKVEASFISDRLRKVAIWYEDNNQLDQALAHLQKYQDRDPEFFNMMLDRIAKRYAVEN